MIRKLFLTKEIVSKDGVVHFRRYRLIETPWFSIYIHHILESDQDKHLHNHPWHFSSYILYGGYEETRYLNTNGRFVDYLSFTRIVKWKTSFKINEFHKIKLLKNCCWSLVFTGKRINPEWGYLTEKGFIESNEYRIRKNKGEFK